MLHCWFLSKILMKFNSDANCECVQLERQHSGGKFSVVSHFLTCLRVQDGSRLPLF